MVKLLRSGGWSVWRHERTNTSLGQPQWHYLVFVRDAGAGPSAEATDTSANDTPVRFVDARIKSIPNTLPDVLFQQKSVVYLQTCRR